MENQRHAWQKIGDMHEKGTQLDIFDCYIYFGVFKKYEPLLGHGGKKCQPNKPLLCGFESYPPTSLFHMHCSHHERWVGLEGVLLGGLLYQRDI